MMKKNIDKYEQVKTLPKTAKSIADFCRDQGYSTSNLYNQYKKKKILGVKIVVFQGFNFIVPD